jgi:3-phenylpropionate/trans-cinnamate dioxygenase ferredoxin reductase subunit
MHTRRHFVIVGAGQAGGWAAKTLRDRGFADRITIIGEERHPPYERPPLSKQILVSESPASSSYLWPLEKLQQLEIELHCSSTAKSVNRSTREVHLQDGRTIRYDRLLLATGARPRSLDVPGANLQGIHYLRTIADCLDIRDGLKSAKRLLVVGGGWIGLEVAAAAVKLRVPVTLVEAADQLCGRVLPKVSADFFLSLHRARGVEVRLGVRPVSFRGDKWVESVEFADGSTVACSMVVVGIGVVPNTGLAAECGLQVENGIVVDAGNRTTDPDIFAAGDVTNQPGSTVGQRYRLESWHNAQHQGIGAAKAMLGEKSRSSELPWFWSDQYDLNFQLLGLPSASDRIFIKGKPNTGRFLQFFVTNARINAVAAFNSPRELREAKRLMLANKPFDEAAISASATLC